MAVIPSIERQKERNDKPSEEMGRLEDLKGVVMKLQTECSTMFQKVSPRLIQEVLSVQRLNPNQIPMFTLEVITKKAGEGGIDCDTIREHIWNTTGKMPAIYGNGTHYVTNQMLTLETLKRLNDFEHVLKVTGEYSGASYASTTSTRECYVELEDIWRTKRGEPSPKA